MKARLYAPLLAVCAASLLAAPSALAAGTSSISGKVTSLATGAELAHIRVTAYEAEGTNAKVISTETGEFGAYKLEQLPAGKYVVGFQPDYENPSDYGLQFYPEKARFAEAEKVTIAKEGEEKPNINAKLGPGATVTGKVTDAGTGQSVEGIIVFAIAVGSTGEPVGVTETGSDGQYTIIGLASGSVDIAFLSQSVGPEGEEEQLGGPYISQIYNGESLFEADIESDIFALLGTPLEVKAGDTSIANAALVRKAPFATQAPTLTGTPAVGQVLSCVPGTWTGLPEIGYSYSWLRNGVPIAGAATNIYAIQTADQGDSIVCQVAASNKSGSATAISNALAIPAPVVPPAPTPLLRLGAGKQLAVHAGAVGVKLSCTVAACKGSVELTAAKGKTVLGKVAYTLAAGKSQTLSLKLNAAGKKALAKAKGHKGLSAELAASLEGGTSVSEKIQLSSAKPAGKHKKAKHS
ncbi:MAG TPA: carboxypeptidase-like regulatory domain-containing protein [Solirubrobacteraceae bacterium]|jgi:hypothetical protein